MDDALLTAFQEACRQTWQAYADAYRTRYGADPVRNAKINKQVQALVKNLGSEEGPAVAGWFVAHPNAYYVGKGHSMGALVADCEKLRTEWATGAMMTQGKARQTDRTGTNAGAADEAMKILEKAGVA